MELKQRILKLKEEKNAVILAHNYQLQEIQEVADFVGDSLELARIAQGVDKDLIIFCGVDFMADMAKILNPEKKVIVPDATAICPMARQLSVDVIKEEKKKHPGAAVVLYVNTTAEAKALADCLCTSANAAEIVNAMGSDTVLFGPDRNLAAYVQKRTNKKVIPIPEFGCCPTHMRFNAEHVKQMRHKHPNAKVIVHPECTPDVQALADYVESTSGMLRIARQENAGSFIIGTEMGLIERMRRGIPDKKFYPLHDAICPNMKKNTLEKVLFALEDEAPEVHVPACISEGARKALGLMLELSKGGAKA